MVAFLTTGSDVCSNRFEEIIPASRSLRLTMSPLLRIFQQFKLIASSSSNSARNPTSQFLIKTVQTSFQAVDWCCKYFVSAQQCITTTVVEREEVDAFTRLHLGFHLSASLPQLLSSYESTQRNLSKALPTTAVHWPVGQYYHYIQSDTESTITASYTHLGFLQIRKGKSILQMEATLVFGLACLCPSCWSVVQA